MALDDIRIVLIEPIHPGNIGAVARAMKTMSLSRLILVRPSNFPSEDADRRATGAIDLLEQAQVVDNLEAAVGDCRLVIGCSARTRSFPNPMLEPRQCGTQLIEETASGEPAAVLFGTERTGLTNEDLDQCTFQVQIPANPNFSSLNLASAVQLVCYEIFIAAGKPVFADTVKPWNRPSLNIEMEYFYQHLERSLDSRGYLDGEMREITMMKFRHLFGRARPNSGELKILHTLMRLIHPTGD